MKRLKLLTVLAAVAVASVTSAQATDKALLNTLVQKGYLTSAEASNLSKTNVHHDLDRGVRFGEQPDTNSLVLGGKVDARYQFSDSKQKDVTPAIAKEKRSSFLITKAELGMKASVWEDIRIELAAKFRDNTTSLDTALISWDYMEELSFDVGYGATPAGYEGSNSSTYVKTLDRSTASKFFYEQLGFGHYHVGIFARGQNVADLEGWRYAAAITRPDNAIFGDRNVTFPVEAKNNTPAVFASTAYNFNHEDVNFDLGLSFGYQKNQRMVSSTQAVGGNRVDTNDFLGNTHVNVAFQDFNLLVEAYGGLLKKGKIDGTGYKTAKPWGLTVQPSYMYNDQYEFVFSYSVVRAKNVVQNNLGTTANTNSTGARLDAVSSPLKDLTAGGSGIGSLNYNKVSTYGLNMNYFPIKGSKQLRIGAGYEYLQAKKGSGAITNGSTTAAGSKVNSHIIRTDIRLVF